MMEKILFLAVLAIASTQIHAELKWTDLRTTWGPSNVGYFNRIPRSIRDPLFVSQNWTMTSTNCSNNGSFNGFQAVIPGDYSAGLLFDSNGIVAGIQMLLNKSSILAPGNNVNYPNLPVYQSQTFDNEDYFVLTMYFIEPTRICTSGRNETDLENEGTGTHVFIQNGTSPNGPLVQIPKNRTVALAENWSKNQCLQGMGLHNFYGVEQYQSKNCTEMFPFFGLYNNDGELLGFGSANPGTVVNPRFENPSSGAIALIIGPTQVPQCLLETQASIGLTTFHVYFVDQPWLISCENRKN
jgi:charged multivesicular body protein 7